MIMLRLEGNAASLAQDIHGKQKQQKRTSTFLEFNKAEKGILLCTDVAARGLDIPAVDWIIQFDPPDDPKEYIHRVGRAIRGKTGQGRALLMLLPQELGFLKYLKVRSDSAGMVVRLLTVRSSVCLLFPAASFKLPSTLITSSLSSQSSLVVSA